MHSLCDDPIDDIFFELCIVSGIENNSIAERMKPDDCKGVVVYNVLVENNLIFCVGECSISADMPGVDRKKREEFLDAKGLLGCLLHFNLELF